MPWYPINPITSTNAHSFAFSTFNWSMNHSAEDFLVYETIAQQIHKLKFTNDTLG